MFSVYPFPLWWLREYTFCLIIVIKSEVWTIIQWNNGMRSMCLYILIPLHNHIYILGTVLTKTCFTYVHKTIPDNFIGHSTGSWKIGVLMVPCAGNTNNDIWFVLLKRKRMTYDDITIKGSHVLLSGANLALAGIPLSNAVGENRQCSLKIMLI